MSWETRNGRGAYYTRSRRNGGRIIREYIGTGDFALARAHADAQERQQRQAEAARLRQQKATDQSLDADIDQFCRLTDGIARAVLLAAGYHNHKGQWRKRRGTESKGQPNRPNQAPRRS
jgi:hypothetical protein